MDHEINQLWKYRWKCRTCQRPQVSTKKQGTAVGGTGQCNASKSCTEQWGDCKEWFWRYDFSQPYACELEGPFTLSLLLNQKNLKMRTVSYFEDYQFIYKGLLLSETSTSLFLVSVCQENLRHDKLSPLVCHWGFLKTLCKTYSERHSCGGSEVINTTSVHGMRVWSLASLSGLRIQCCCELWCRSQTWHESCMFVPVV